MKTELGNKSLKNYWQPAHAGRFTMKLSLDLTQAALSGKYYQIPNLWLALENGKITKSELTLTAKVPGISEEQFQQIAKGAEETCQ